MEIRVERRVVDNRVLVLGLDRLYRNRMPDLEVTQLLECARTVARALRIAEASVPVEGYYADLPELSEYFRLMRALQSLDQSNEEHVSTLPEFQLLRTLATSGLYGPTEPGYLLPRGRDPLSQALRRTAPSQWTVAELIPLAHSIAVTSADFSLVALAARANDPVTVAATRESVVLYAGVEFGREAVRIEYDWRVDDQLAAVANQFIHTLNQFVLIPLPSANAENAEKFYSAFEANDILGRCVMIGMDPGSSIPRYYHWAIVGRSKLDMQVDEFWDQELWTTARHVAEGTVRRRSGLTSA